MDTLEKIETLDALQRSRQSFLDAITGSSTPNGTFFHVGRCSKQEGTNYFLFADDPGMIGKGYADLRDLPLGGNLDRDHSEIGLS